MRARRRFFIRLPAYDLREAATRNVAVRTWDALSRDRTGYRTGQLRSRATTAFTPESCYSLIAMAHPLLSRPAQVDGDLAAP